MIPVYQVLDIFINIFENVNHLFFYCNNVLISLSNIFYVAP